MLAAESHLLLEDKDSINKDKDTDSNGHSARSELMHDVDLSPPHQIESGMLGSFEVIPPQAAT